MHTAATAMGARFFHACGYNAPEETIVHWRPERLRLEPGITFTDPQGNRREMQQSDLDVILQMAHRLPDGRIVGQRADVDGQARQHVADLPQLAGIRRRQQ
jgi:hypothetical protein